MSDIIKSFPCSTPKGRVFGHFIANLKKISCHIVDKDDLYSLYFSLSIIWQQCLFKFAIKCQMTLPGRASQGKYLIIYDNWCSDDLVHIFFFQFRLKLRTYITLSLSVLKKYVQILGNTMKMALYACKAKFWKKTHLTKENNPDFKLPLLNFIEFGTLCINLEICKNEL